MEYRELHIRPRKKRTRFYIDNELLTEMAPHLGPHGIALYNALAKHADAEDQDCFPAYETLMRQSGIGKRNTISKYLKLLEQYRLIKKEYVPEPEIRKSSLYTLLDVSEWRIPRDTAVSDEKHASIPRANHPYPSSAESGISTDTRSHTKEKSDQRTQSPHPAPPARREEPQEEEKERVRSNLQETREYLESKGIIKKDRLSNKHPP